MKTSVTRKQEERGLHRRYEDFSDKKTGERCPHRRYEDLGDKKTGGEMSSSK
ncbi:hypothetical protein [Bacillus sp. RO1]|uniref:hypothetical protein n=1 Tax=Bacillus sp. RO1 TaxID=2722703 RepID=UPI001456E2E3|nr:hypothetical protein [Bacillus sp. RO1]NLP52321.1 hypothetical protein [Bacillus sp. RO1]